MTPPQNKGNSVNKSHCFAMICITRQKLGQDTKYTATLGLFFPVYDKSLSFLYSDEHL